jgi:hypothetical protein
MIKREQIDSQIDIILYAYVDEQIYYQLDKLFENFLREELDDQLYTELDINLRLELYRYLNNGVLR